MFFTKSQQKNADDNKFSPEKSFQYIKGEKFGTSVRVAHVKDNYVYFTDDTRISVSVFDEYLVEEEFVENDFTFENLKAPGMSDILSQNLENPSVKNLSTNITISDKSSQEKKSMNENISPVGLILNKQNPEETKFQINIKVKVPDKNLMGVLLTSFGEEETINELYNYVFSQIDFTELKEELQIAIQKHYKITKKDDKS